MKNFEVNLAESELKIVLEALTELEQKMARICESSEDEDEISDVGNDLIEVRLLLKPLKKRAIDMYGDNIVNFSREAL
ncbi:hypothetical protein [Microbulbifer halophilus]|uniref:Uncharacterized protein n=1 Tax=Microbulbifer halophilus TaxID=453963 RepID=A0ABW5EC82_9GAMM|nr:hypothetical protein [Microbulbifer halophilus]MCW8126574.1 hypothetical protein [Microbulbifer halophilus]